MYALTMMALALVLAPPPGPDPQVRCAVLVNDALSRPIKDARVTCDGVRAKGSDGTYTAHVAASSNGHVIKVSRSGFLPQARTFLASGQATALVYLRRRAEPYLIDEGSERPFVAQRGKLLVKLDLWDRATSTPLPRPTVMAELAPLLTALKLVEVPTRGALIHRGNLCRGGDLLALARADGEAFADDIVPELDALRAHARVLSAGPLVRFDAEQDNSLGHVIGVSGLAGVDLAPFAAGHGATWDAANRKLVLPRAIGLGAAEVTRALEAAHPGARARLERGVDWVCQF